jgi:hypothetical protein
MKEKLVECERPGCKVRKPDEEMIYNVREDMYFCEQGCSDLYFEVERKDEND